MFDVLDITPETTAPPAISPAQGVPSARDVQDRIMAIARRLGKLDDMELADIERRRHLGLPLHTAERGIAPAMVTTHAALAEPAERDSEDEIAHEHDTLTAKQPAPADAGGLFDWLPAP